MVKLKRIVLGCTANCYPWFDHFRGVLKRLVEARTKAETQRIDAQVRADGHRAEAEAQAAAMKLAAQAEAEAVRVKTEAEVSALREREQAAEAYSAHPALLRLQELETLRELARTANARIYIGFDKHRALDTNGARGK
jgi:regulator of protease activity HflC (stomatin/prohibitin superfamily)